MSTFFPESTVPHIMLKASPALGELLHAAKSPPRTDQTPIYIQNAMEKIECEATARGLSRSPWLTIVTATTMTIGTPQSIAAVAKHIIATVPRSEVVEAFDFMREVGMSCTVMNGIPRTAVMLMALNASLPLSIRASLSKATPRHIDENNIASVQARGRTLWNSIHGRFADVVERKFSEAHPDLPSFAIGTMYGNCLRTGRVTTSIGSIACLQAQPGFALQVFDHVNGLKNTWKDGSWRSDEGIGEETAVKWLLGDEGCTWILEKVNEMVEAIEYVLRSRLTQVGSKL